MRQKPNCPIRVSCQSRQHQVTPSCAHKTQGCGCVFGGLEGKVFIDLTFILRPLCGHVSGPSLLLSLNFFVCKNGGDIVSILWVWHDDKIKHSLWTLPFDKRLLLLRPRCPGKGLSFVPGAVLGLWPGPAILLEAEGRREGRQRASCLRPP